MLQTKTFYGLNLGEKMLQITLKQQEADAKAKKTAEEARIKEA